VDWCIKEGPGFSISFYQLYGTLLGSIAQSIAVVLFETVISKWHVRPAFWVTTVFQAISTCIEIVMLERWNHTLFGTIAGKDRWPDMLFYLVGTQTLDKIIDMLDFMPSNVLVGKLCPPSVEATIFAVLAGVQNAGSNMARINGAIFIEYLGVTYKSGSEKDAPDCQNPETTILGLEMQNITWARVLGGIVMPLITIPFTWLLLPDKKLTDDFLDAEDDAAMEMMAGGGVGREGPGEVPIVDAENNNTMPISGMSPSMGLAASTIASVASLQRPYAGSRFL
jgi:hypothetical protein